MAIFMVRAGRYGEYEAMNLKRGIASIGWVELPDLSKIDIREALRALYQEMNPEASKGQVDNGTAQVWKFVHEIKVGDYIAMPLKSQSAIAIGRVKGNYFYEALENNARHHREVEWLKTIPRSAFDKDLLYSLGAIQTVFRISRNNAEERILAMLRGARSKQPSAKEVNGGPKDKQGDELPLEQEPDIEERARADILDYIKAKFTGHGLPTLVDAVLKAQGYKIEVSPPGPDRGVDILASGGPPGFDHPRIAVQVKSTDDQVRGPDLQQFQGAMNDHKADFGLFVSWSGFNSEALRRAKTEYFSMRLWDADDLIDAILENYERFDEDIRAELPLKHVWTLVTNASLER